ncbi:hypothetical protein FKM82_013040 [Ascaphus truei]
MGGKDDHSAPAAVNHSSAANPKNLELRFTGFRIVASTCFGILIFAAVLAAYVVDCQIVQDESFLISLGIYGLVMALHLLLQSFFAFLELRRVRNRTTECSYQMTVALTIAAYQEDPVYLRQCLDSCRTVRYPRDQLKIILVVDGNTADDAYMMEMFKDVFHGDDVGTYVWEENYHTGKKSEKEKGEKEKGEKEKGEEEKGGEDEEEKGEEEKEPESCQVTVESKPLNEDCGRKIVEELIKTKRCVCIMQKWGGKREVMYTAFKALGKAVDFVQVCDSDTKLDDMATVEMVKVLESNDRYGAVGGDVRILNPYDSFISFMSSLRYWMAFNVERACQSYFDCVSCISGPLGMYRNDVLQSFLESWYNQVFLGTTCTLGDDRHLTNRLLSLGYSTKYTPKSRAYSETPSEYLRWLNQQTRWTKSYFREWCYNAQWWHKHHLWMTYESVVTGIFPFFVTFTIIKLFYAGSLWNILWVLLCIQIMALTKALYACWLRGNMIMLLMSLYSMLYMTGLLPTKYFAILTMTKTTWGTSGRKKIVGNYMPLLPLSIWAAILLGGLCYTIYLDCLKDWSTSRQQHELFYLLYGSLAYAGYWVSMALIYWVCVKKCCRKRSQTVDLIHDLPESNKLCGPQDV